MNTASGVQALSQFPWTQAAAVNDQYFTALSNGGLGHLPNPATDDSITTDQVVGRRMQKPPLEQQSKLRFNPNVQGNIYYQSDSNRINTAGQQIDKLAMKGMGVIGTDQFGQYNKMILKPPGTMLYSATSNTPTESSTDSIGVILWILIGVGVIALLGRSTSVPVLL